ISRAAAAINEPMDRALILVRIVTSLFRGSRNLEPVQVHNRCLPVWLGRTCHLWESPSVTRLCPPSQSSARKHMHFCKQIKLLELTVAVESGHFTALD
ncbi:MAG: hypothetical protein N3G20_03525, partial [Verrucomicrobiae bacterium]|nr:hypothetical protein [Verrucomicrobiae bacterium]